MTREEHQLVISMLSHQQHLIETLIQVFKSNNLLQKGETLDAYAAIAFPGEDAHMQLERQVHTGYLAFGTALGVKHLPETAIGG